MNTVADYAGAQELIALKKWIGEEFALSTDASPVGDDPATTAALQIAIRITERLVEIVDPTPEKVDHGNVFEVRDTSVEAPLRTLAALIDEHKPKGYAFALYLFQTGIANGNVFYISNAQRPDIIQAMKNWLRKQVQ